MKSIMYLLDIAKLEELKSFMWTEKGFHVWNDACEKEADRMDAIINSSVATVVDTPATLDEPLVVPADKILVGVGIGWFEGVIRESRDVDLFPFHLSEHDKLTTLLCLRRDVAEQVVPDYNLKNKGMGTCIILDNDSGYWALRIRGLYQ